MTCVREHVVTCVRVNRLTFVLTTRSAYFLRYGGCAITSWAARQACEAPPILDPSPTPMHEDEVRDHTSWVKWATAHLAHRGSLTPLTQDSLSLLSLSLSPPPPPPTLCLLRIPEYYKVFILTK